MIREGRKRVVYLKPFPSLKDFSFYRPIHHIRGGRRRGEREASPFLRAAGRAGITPLPLTYKKISRIGGGKGFDLLILPGEGRVKTLLLFLA